ncbi:MAG: carbon-nitrogen hydrolase family protein [Proteobacteria bacterium]|jgi:predicted amidohydrolase|nr:carbon-nitrogen hydrolase family protein [Pseudomonadota bacterium]
MSSPQKLKVSVIQMTSVDQAAVNLSHIKEQIEMASREFLPDLICFPENALYMRIVEGQKIPGFTLQDSCFSELAELARKFGTTFHLGSVPVRKNEKLTNASVLIEANGKISVSYEKMHLFDIELEGQKPIRESDVFSAGEGPRVFKLKDWSVGQTICYDLRFSDLYLHYAKTAVDVILVPSAFLVPTGKAHWHSLLRARAIESQCYVIAAAQAGVHVSGQAQRSTFGHSVVVSPWGEILSEGNGVGPEALHVELHREVIDKVRRQIPMAHHRRKY